MNLDRIESLAAVLERVPRLSEIEIRTEDATLLLRRATVALPAPAPASAATPAADPAPAAADTPASTSVFATAHVVGVFHDRRGAAVAAGDRVGQGDVLGQIDTMRIPNECVAPVAGRVVAVCVRDGDAVEYGQPLFEIAPEDAR